MLTCLKFLALQKSIDIKEIIIADGGSKDKTIEVANSFSCKIIKNTERINKFGKKLLILNTKTEYLCLLDSDNFLTDEKYLSKMLLLIKSKINCIGVDSLYYSRPQKFFLLDEYLAQIGADDPLASFLGYYDRFSLFENSWTGVDGIKVISSELNGFFFKYEDNKTNHVPVPIGANGTILRCSTFREQQEYNELDGFEHVFHCNQLLLRADSNNNLWAKCNVGLVHHHGTTLFIFFKKKLRRYLRKSNERSFQPTINLALRRLIPLLKNLVVSDMKIPYKLLHITLIFISILTLIIGLLLRAFFGLKEKSLNV